MTETFLGREDGDRWNVFKKDRNMAGEMTNVVNQVDEIEVTILDGTKDPYEVVLKGFSKDGFFKIYSSKEFDFQLARKPKEEKPNLHNLKGGGFPD